MVKLQLTIVMTTVGRWVARKSVLEVSEAVGRLKLSQNKSDLDDNFFVSSSRCS